MTDSQVARAARIDTATLSDALDKLGNINGPVPRHHPARPRLSHGGPRLHHPLWPGGQSRAAPSAISSMTCPMAASSSLDNGGRTDATVWGDILTEIAHRRKLAGTVVDGVNRDVYLCRELGYPIFSVRAYMRTGKDRVQVEGTNVPVTIGGARVALATSSSAIPMACWPSPPNMPMPCSPPPSIYWKPKKPSARRSVAGCGSMRRG